MKINLKFLANPYMAYVVIWTLGLLVYLLEWSDMFPAITLGLFLFVSISIILCYTIGQWLGRKKFFEFRNVSSFLNIKTLFIVNAALWIISFVYSGLPLYEILTGVDYAYSDFGIPILIVFITCFNSFLCVYCFHCYLSSRNKKYVLYYLFCLGLYILAYSRGLIMVTLISSIFLWLSAKGNVVKTKHILILFTGALIILYGFGYAGNIRTAQSVARDNNASGYAYDNTLILEIASASPAFTKNIIPNEYFWTYVYIASPMSNLQYNVSKQELRTYTMSDFVNLIINETWYETVSKRIGEIYPWLKRREVPLVIDNLNVSTTYVKSFMYMGYLGMIILLVHILVMPIIYLKILGLKSQYLPVAVAIMCSIYFFSIFDNMFIFVGTGPQLLFPLFFEFRDRLRKKQAL